MNKKFLLCTLALCIVPSAKAMRDDVELDRALRRFAGSLDTLVGEARWTAFLNQVVAVLRAHPGDWPAQLPEIKNLCTANRALVDAHGGLRRMGPPRREHFDRPWRRDPRELRGRPRHRGPWERRGHGDRPRAQWKPVTDELAVQYVAHWEEKFRELRHACLPPAPDIERRRPEIDPRRHPDIRPREGMHRGIAPRRHGTGPSWTDVRARLLVEDPTREEALAGWETIQVDRKARLEEWKTTYPEFARHEMLFRPFHDPRRRGIRREDPRREAARNAWKAIQAEWARQQKVWIDAHPDLARRIKEERERGRRPHEAPEIGGREHHRRPLHRRGYRGH